ncbi:MAG: DNA adenine methylase [Symbiobacteriia bacterium]
MTIATTERAGYIRCKISASCHSTNWWETGMKGTAERNAARVSPYFKWAGGKRRLLSRLLPALPPSYGRYFEPFFGGGALFFALGPESAVLSDTNDELMNAHRVIRDKVDELIDSLSLLSVSNEQFYALRSARPTTDVDRAVRFIYLNRTAFNGLYRVNQQGEFNVPFGCKPGTVICDVAHLKRVSAALHHADLLTTDFEDAVKAATVGDVVYFDPPYTVKHENNGFRRYNEALFSWRDQERLASLAKGLAAAEVHVVVSNAYHEDIRQLYDFLTPLVVERGSLISAKTAGRTTIREYIFSSSSFTKNVVEVPH